MDYLEIVKKYTPKENRIKNMILSFISGGIVGAISYELDFYFDTNVMLLFWIIFSSIITGMGEFDNLVDKFKMGLIIPITGFSHSVTASSLEYKNEGFITGIGSNYFKLAGSVILYGIISSFILCLIKEFIICI